MPQEQDISAYDRALLDIWVGLVELEGRDAWSSRGAARTTIFVRGRDAVEFMESATRFLDARDLSIRSIVKLFPAWSDEVELNAEAVALIAGPWESDVQWTGLRQ